MLAIESLHRNFSGVCKEAAATPLARYLAWRCVSAMPSELSPGFDERALGDAYEDLATLLGRSGAESSDVHVWAARSRFHGCLPKWRLDWEGGRGLFAEDSAPTGPLEGVDLFGNGLGREAWASKARELAQRLTGMRLWLPALSSARKQTACLDALERSLGHIGSKGFDWRLGFGGRALVLDAPLSESRSGVESAQGWLWACAQRGERPEKAILKAWAFGVDSKLGELLREPSGRASLAPWNLRPNHAAHIRRKAIRLVACGAISKSWIADPWTRACSLALHGDGVDLWDALMGRSRIVSRLSCDAMAALELIASDCVSRKAAQTQR